ncbi:hypothetical protein EJ05DRAFT_525317 [Pseudovirgaria hyperparasitica]|uniref:Uncharacterized protein n=1 Tax=Pseudovirgaria hyperparasitica TaxID=470096 RepID=A0A6A6WBK3_9PEZI|nr:uncharacterized protein EJ05DRAFT_525317 [Pseudovirgaria hyperparasitica]KAF2760212.1 hypothetical protein EJ05DRAFT_525317 [Pseudovirgaria hyperparasitica]
MSATSGGVICLHVEDVSSYIIPTSRRSQSRTISSSALTAEPTDPPIVSSVAENSLIKKVSGNSRLTRSPTPQTRIFNVPGGFSANYSPDSPLSELKTSSRGNNKNFIEIEVVHPTIQVNPLPTLLGYIGFRWNKEKLGVIDMVNLGTLLQLRHLGLGDTSKAGLLNQTDQHGEVKKLGAMIMYQDGYHVPIEASEFHWNFG